MSDLEQPGEQDSANPADAGGAGNESQAADVNNQDESNPDLESDDQPEEDEEVEIGDKKYALPKSAAEKLKSERMMNADYTRKTQELADQRKTFETEQNQGREAMKAQRQLVTDLAKVTAIDDQLSELRKIDLSQHVDSDPVGVQRVMLQIQQLEARRNTAAQEVAQKQQQYDLEKQQGIAKQIQELNGYVAREIPGWSQERDNQIGDYAAAQGLKGEEYLKAVIRNPAFVKILDKAEKYDRLEKSRSAKPAPAPAPAPVTRVTAAKPAAKSPNSMSTDEWMAHRNAQVRKKA